MSTKKVGFRLILTLNFPPPQKSKILKIPSDMDINKIQKTSFSRPLLQGNSNIPWKEEKVKANDESINSK